MSEGTAGASSEFAPAKVNLALHVTGRRSDGYHLLDSVVVFLALGDRLHVAPAEHVTLAVTGPQGPGVPVDGNLVLKAAAALAQAAGRPCPGASLTLDKHIPAAAGLGGGSSDAAAALRALNRMWDVGLDASELMRLGEGIGADVPVCVAPTAARMAGIGECVAPLPALPQVHVLLVNPGCSLATATVFAGLTKRDNPGLPELPGQWRGVSHLVEYLGACRNDLAAPAIAAAPAIQEVLAALAAEPACLLARMSGSGATCFGLFATAEDAARASARLAQTHPGWWVAAARTL
ncbi:MAG TPA: 4-(cytidine 5'-diphospho)-2-C-methyl-D-erythritol kinase [Aestuariivirgaceae bacterium]|nr:4-(cytidine 5'-diphospho)-2-C-methyl-D-erythritol kinase [Aestuariivirgaceae bacterium]